MLVASSGPQVPTEQVGWVFSDNQRLLILSHLRWDAYSNGLERDKTDRTWLILKVRVCC